MQDLPTVVASSVIRSANKGESHGGVYLVDLEAEEYRQVIDWNKSDISWEGRGGDRGLRGIDFYNGNIYLAASDEIFVFDQQFNRIKTYKNKFLKHIHEIDIHSDKLYVVSTGYNSILEFDLDSESFTNGYHVEGLNKKGLTPELLNTRGLLTYITAKLSKNLPWMNSRPEPKLKTFDPNSETGPPKKDIFHLNSVSYRDNSIYFSGTNLKSLFYIESNKLHKYAEIPSGTHNAIPYKRGVLMNNTNKNSVLYSTKNGEKIQEFPIKMYNENRLFMNNMPKDYARQGFARGLCTKDDLIIAGSSPATISVFKLGKSEPIKTVNLTMDVRNSIHGLEIWPY